MDSFLRLQAIYNGNVCELERRLQDVDSWSIDKAVLGGMTLLNFAARAGQVMAVKLLLDKGAKADKNTFNHAAAGGNVEMGHLFLQHRICPGLESLGYACTHGRGDFAQFLLEHGAKVNGSVHSRPLHQATMNGHREVVQLLLESGASVFIEDSVGRKPLALAMTFRHYDIARDLVAAGAPVDSSRDLVHFSLLTYAKAVAKTEPQMKVLLEECLEPAVAQRPWRDRPPALGAHRSP